MPGLPQLEYVPALAPTIRTPFHEPRLTRVRCAAVLLVSWICAFAAVTPVWCSPQIAQEQMRPVSRGTGAMETALQIADADSAMSALLNAVEADPDHPLAAEALMRAGFIAYVVGDADRAQVIFERADVMGVPEAKMWRGLALLSAGRVEAASRALRGYDSGEDERAREAAALALAACDLAEGDVESGEARCKRIIDAGGAYSIAASLLLRRSVPRALDAEENDRWARLLAERHPLSYETSLARHLSEISHELEREGDTIEEEIVLEEDPGAGAQGTHGEPGGGSDDRGQASDEAQSSARAGADDAGASVQRRVYSVQVGAFVDTRNAESLVQSLLAKGYDAVRIESETRRGTLFHCVRVGRFRNREDAVLKASELKEDEGLGTTVLEGVRQSAPE